MDEDKASAITLLALLHSVKLPKQNFMCAHGQVCTKMGNFPVDYLRSPDKIRSFKPSRGLKRISDFYSSSLIFR